MSNQHQVYREILKTLKQTLAIRGKSEGHGITLAMLITGILMGKKAQRSAISAEAALTMKDKSLEKRAARWVKNEKVTPEMYYYPFAREILAHLSQQTLTLAMDGSQVGRGCMALVIGVVYHQRLLPLIWVVYQGKKGHAARENTGSDCPTSARIAKRNARNGKQNASPADTIHLSIKNTSPGGTP